MIVASKKHKRLGCRSPGLLKGLHQVVFWQLDDSILVHLSVAVKARGFARLVD